MHSGILQDIHENLVFHLQITACGNTILINSQECLIQFESALLYNL